MKYFICFLLLIIAFETYAIHDFKKVCDHRNNEISRWIHKYYHDND